LIGSFELVNSYFNKFSIKNNRIFNFTFTKNNFESQQLYLDCIDALHALGMKKSEAKKKASAAKKTKASS
jgi:Holliday junction resolvasome RuvABC DNA-binding subunit